MGKLYNRNIFRFPALFIMHFFIFSPILYGMGMDINTATMLSTFISGSVTMILSHVPPVTYLFIPLKDGGCW